ncbi:MAG: SHOCT domain-containing protein [Candidatus Altiarchaeota archaeon]
MEPSFTMQTGRAAWNMGVRYDPLFGRDALFGFIPKFLVWNIVIVLVVVLIFYWLTRDSKKCRETPLDILKKRYVSGELDRKTYLQMKEDISE